MNKKIQKIPLSWLVPVEIKNAFADFCTANGFVIQDDCAGALTLWQHVPAEIRELAKQEAKGLREADTQFWDDFAAGLRLALHARQESPPKKQKKK